MKTVITYMAVLIVTVQFSYAQDAGKGFQWPDNQKAAVCLTFDDGQDSHLDIALPILESYGVRATFYCHGNSQPLHNRISEWKTLVKKGHELGNHSLFHPCDGTKFDWIKPEYDLNQYSLAQIRTELYTANTLLEAIDGKTERTYGYTCSNFKVRGDTSYVDVVEQMFSAARSDGPIPTTMDSFNISFAPSWCVDSPTGEELIDYVKEARDNGTIATFMFHSVGGGYLNVSTEALKELLTYLEDNDQDYWVDTFYNVTNYVSQQH